MPPNPSVSHWTLISANDFWTLWAIIAVGTAVSLWLEGRYRWADKLSAPVVGLLMAMALSNTHVVPTESPAYDFIGDWLVPLALPLLLMRANIVQIARETGKLFLAVHLSAVGTIVAAFAAVALLRGHVPEVDKAAAIMTGSYIGGMVNYAAVSSATQASGSLNASLIVADNLVMAGIFVMILSMAGSRWFLARYGHPHTNEDGTGVMLAEDVEESKQPATAVGLATAIGLAFAIVAIALGMGKLIGAWLPTGEGSGLGRSVLVALLTNKYVLITGVSLLVATVFHKHLTHLHGYEEVGRYLLFLFLFSIGLPADLVAVLKESPLLFVLCLIMSLGNVVATMVLGKLFRLSLEDCLISINATVGGPPTAAAMAISRGWPRLVLPGLLAGLWGYVIGTPLGMMVYAVVAGR
jgi:uncharacterized membrane protein